MSSDENSPTVPGRPPAIFVYCAASLGIAVVAFLSAMGMAAVTESGTLVARAFVFGYLSVPGVVAVVAARNVWNGSRRGTEALGAVLTLAAWISLLIFVFGIIAGGPKGAAISVPSGAVFAVVGALLLGLRSAPVTQFVLDMHMYREDLRTGAAPSFAGADESDVELDVAMESDTSAPIEDQVESRARR